MRAKRPNVERTTKWYRENLSRPLSESLKNVSRIDRRPRTTGFKASSSGPARAELTMFKTKTTWPHPRQVIDKTDKADVVDDPGRELR